MLGTRDNIEENIQGLDFCEIYAYSMTLVFDFARVQNSLY